MPENPRKTKAFKNPLLQSTEAGIPEQPSLPSQEGMRAIPGGQTGLNSFEQRNVRMTNWVDRSLKARLDSLVSQRGSSRSRLLNEAITDLLRKYKAS